MKKLELGGVFILALVLRLALLSYRINVLNITPLQNSPDAIEYLLLGKALLNGWDWSSGYFAARPPLMPLLVAAVYTVFGESQTAVAVANVILSAATATLACLIAAQLTHSIPAARLAGILVAIDPASIANSINVQAETLANFWFALSMLFLAHTIQRQKVRDAALAGLALGLATLARPTTIYLFIFALPVFVFIAKHLRDRLRLYFAFAVFPALFALLWSARNLAYIGEYTYTTVSDFNLLFYRAVSVERWARGGVSDDAIRREFAIEVERRLGSSVDPSEVDAGFFWRNFSDKDGRRVRIMRQMALEVYLAHPLWYAATIPAGVYHIYAYTDMFGEPFVPELLYNLFLYAAAAAGGVICWRRRWWPTLAISLTVIGYITLATLISQTTGMDTRMRTSAAAAFAVPAAVGLLTAWETLFRSRRNGRGLVEGAGLDERQPQ